MFYTKSPDEDIRNMDKCEIKTKNFWAEKAAEKFLSQKFKFSKTVFWDNNYILLQCVNLQKIGHKSWRASRNVKQIYTEVSQCKTMKTNELSF